MNILRHKKWHVRTKENMQRVRKDEAKAADQEQQRLERQILAENERRLAALRSQAQQRNDATFGFGRAETNITEDLAVSAETGHVNLFQDLEREERKNLGTGNTEYEDEKKKEQQEWESKMGIQKCLGEGSNELDKKGEWYEKMPMRRVEDVKEVKYVLPGLLREREKEAEELERSRKREKKKRKRRHSSSSSSDSDDDRKHRKHKKDKKKKKKRKREKEEKESSKISAEQEKHRRLAVMREERVQRERMERSRTQQLLHPEQQKKAPPKPKYNSQFNPDLCRN